MALLCAAGAQPMPAVRDLQRARPAPAGLAGVAGAQNSVAHPPATRREPVTDVLHGARVVDPYRWLEDQDSPETRAWIEAQNAYSQPFLRSFPGRTALQRRTAQLLKVDSIGMPRAAGGRYFFTRRRADQNQAAIYVRERGQDVLLVDPNTMSPDQTTSANILDVSRDGKLLAYGLRQGGEDELRIVLMSVDARADLADQLPKARYFAVAIKPDGSGFYYSRLILNQQKEVVGPRVLFHQVGSEAARDDEIFGKQYGPGEIVLASLSDDARYLALFVLHGSAAEKVEVYFQDLENQGPITPLVNDVNAEFSGEIGGHHLYLLTNWNAPNRRILQVDLRQPAREKWRTVVPESSHVIDDFTVAGGKLFLKYLENVVLHIKLFEPSGKFLREIPLPGPGDGDVAGRWDRDEAFYLFTSFATPRSIYRYRVSTGKQELWGRDHVPVNSGDFQVQQVRYESKDGTRIPMFLVHRKGLKPDGNLPTLLYGYGGFRVSLTPSFSARAMAWVENGGVYAVANLRGGGEFGEKWHQAGMLDKKQNVFDDFLAAAQWLVRHGYTNPRRLAITGRSNGGLLTGAAITQRPDLFQAVVIGYPLLDMVRYHKFLVARFWVPEYGSSENAEQLRYLLAYSPYQNVKPGTRYPAVLLISGDSDTRVAPLHARKMAALLQASTGSDNPVLLHYDTQAGHVTGLPVSKQIEDLTDELSFLFWQLGMGTQPGTPGH